MNISLFLLVLISSFALIFSAIELEDGVLVLDEENFSEALTTYENGLLIEFYAPWCGHCKQLAPEWSKAALALDKATIKLAKLDASEAKDISSEYGIRGFPTIKFFKGGKFSSDYTGGRTSGDIIAWVNKKSGPAIATISTAEELLAFQEKNAVFVLGVFSGPDSAAVKPFNSLASDDDTLPYAQTFEAAVRDTLAVSGDSILVLKDFDGNRADYSITTEELDAAAVKEFILGESTPLIQEFSQTAAKKIFSSPITKHALFFTDKTSDHHAPTLAALQGVATSFKGKSLFVNVPSTENRILEFFGITVDQLPTLILADMGNESGLKKYPFTGELTSAAVSEFLTTFFDGKLQPNLKSEEVAPEDTASPVKVVKGKSFADIVINNDKDVLVEFYAPWCGHCKKLAPIWDELATEVASNSDIVIAKMDSTANEVDVPGLNVKGFPTIYFFPAGDKTHPVLYEGNRELEDFVSYLETKSSKSSGTEDEL